VKGPGGELSERIARDITVEQTAAESGDQQLIVTRRPIVASTARCTADPPSSRTWSPASPRLPEEPRVQGVGYRAALKGRDSSSRSATRTGRDQGTGGHQLRGATADPIQSREPPSSRSARSPPDPQAAQAGAVQARASAMRRVRRQEVVSEHEREDQGSTALKRRRRVRPRPGTAERPRVSFRPIAVSPHS